MKKFGALIAALAVALVPMGQALAEDGDIIITDCSVNSSCFVYNAGDEVNFYKSEDERKAANVNSGLSTIILSDDGASSLYVRALAAAPFGTTESYYDKTVDEDEPTRTVKKIHIGQLERIDYPLNSAKHDATDTLELEYISLAELESVFGATKNADDTYSIDATKWGKTFRDFYAVGSHASKGFYTSTIEYNNETDTGKVWAVVYTWDGEPTDENASITAITVKQVDSDDNTYGYVPVLYFDKTFDCHYKPTQVTDETKMACYICGEDYKWLEVGSQAETCTLVENINIKSKCVKNVKTGVEDHILEFVGLITICGIALTIVNKKDLFRTI